MHPLDLRRVHEDLKLRPRQREFVDQLWIQLERQHILRARRRLPGDEVVGAQGGLDHRRERPQHPVGVQTDQGVDVGRHRGDGRLRIAVGGTLGLLGGIEERFEQGDKRPRGAGVVVEDRADVGLAVRKAGLAQVLRVGAQDDHLLPGQSGPQHEFVEAVDLGLPVPDRGDRVGEALRGGLTLRPGWRLGDAAVRFDLELVDPDLQAVRARHGERALLEHHHAHGLQHRQQLAQRCRASPEVPDEVRHARLGCLVAVGQHQLDRIVFQLFDDRDVLEGMQGRDRLLVHLGERGGVVLGRGLVDRTVPDGSEKAVRPGAGGLGEQVLDARFVGRGHVERLRTVVLRQSDGEMHHSPG